MSSCDHPVPTGAGAHVVPSVEHDPPSVPHGAGVAEALEDAAWWAVGGAPRVQAASAIAAIR